MPNEILPAAQFPPLLLGLSGKKRVGKDTVAEILIREHGYQRFAIADAIKSTALKINPVIVASDGKRWARLRSVYYDCGGTFEGIKTHPEWDHGVREFLQMLGGEIALMNSLFWPAPVIEAAQMHILETGRGAVLTDVRYPWEVEMIRQASGSVARIHRSDFPDTEHTDQHSSEIALDNLDAWNPEYVLDSTPLDTLAERVTAMLTAVAGANSKQ